MKCPFCGAEMVRGELRSRGSNYFLPIGCKPPKWYTEASMKKAGAFALPPSPFKVTFDPQFPFAYWCEACNKIVMDCVQ